MHRGRFKEDLELSYIVELLSLKNRQFCALFDKSMILGT